jgi:hypothetical protein
VKLRFLEECLFEIFLEVEVKIVELMWKVGFTTIGLAGGLFFEARL